MIRLVASAGVRSALFSYCRSLIADRLWQMDQISAEPGADEKACDPDDGSGRETPRGNQLENRSRMKETQRQQAHNGAGQEGDEGVGEHAVAERSLIGVKPKAHAACRHQAEPPRQQVR